MDMLPSPLEALQEAYIEYDLDTLELSDTDSDDGGAPPPGGGHWRSAWGNCAGDDHGDAIEGAAAPAALPDAAPQQQQRPRPASRAETNPLRESRAARPTMSSYSQARKAPLARPTREDALLEQAMQRLERRGGTTVAWPKVDPIALMDARHAASRAARAARLQRRAAAADAAAAAPEPVARKVTHLRKNAGPAGAAGVTKTPRSAKTRAERGVSEFSPLDASPSPPAVAGGGSRSAPVQLAEVRRKLSLDEDDDEQLAEHTHELRAAAAAAEMAAAEAASAKAAADEAAAAEAAQTKADADLLEAAVRAGEADLQRAAAENAAKEAAHSAEAARLTRLKGELEKVEQAVREQTEVRLAMAAAEEALQERRKQLSSRIARRRSRELFRQWQHAAASARARLTKADRHWAWRYLECAWRVWVRWARMQAAEAEAEAHEDAVRRERSAMVVASTHSRRVTMRVFWDRIVCAVNICRQEALVAAEQAKRQQAAERLLAQRAAPPLAETWSPPRAGGATGREIVPINSTGISPVGIYRSVSTQLDFETGPAAAPPPAQDVSMAALAAMFTAEDTPEPPVAAVEEAVALREMTQSDEALVARAAAAALSLAAARRNNTEVALATHGAEGDLLLGKMERRAAERRRRRAALAEHYAAKEQQKAAEAEAATVVSHAREREQRMALRHERRLRKLTEISTDAAREGRRRLLVAATLSARRHAVKAGMARAWRRWLDCIRQTVCKIARVAMARADGILKTTLRAWQCAIRTHQITAMARVAAVRGERLRHRRDVQTKRAWVSFTLAVRDAASGPMRRATLHRRERLCVEAFGDWLKHAAQEVSLHEAKAAGLSMSTDCRRLRASVRVWRAWCLKQKSKPARTPHHNSITGDFSDRSRVCLQVSVPWQRLVRSSPLRYPSGCPPGAAPASKMT